MTTEEIEEKCKIYTEEQCEDVVYTMRYLPSAIKHLVKETYRDGIIEGMKKWNALEKEIRDKLLLSTGQTVEEREYPIIGEIVAYKMDIV